MAILARRWSVAQCRSTASSPANTTTRTITARHFFPSLYQFKFYVEFLAIHYASRSEAKHHFITLCIKNPSRGRPQSGALYRQAPPPPPLAFSLVINNSARHFRSQCNMASHAEQSLRSSRPIHSISRGRRRLYRGALMSRDVLANARSVLAYRLVEHASKYDLPEAATRVTWGGEGAERRKRILFNTSHRRGPALLRNLIRYVVYTT